MKTFSVRLFLLGACLAGSAWASGTLPESEENFRELAPADVESVLAAQGLPVKNYTAEKGQAIYRGNSRIKEITSANPVKNTLTFFVAGESDHISQLHLVLCVNAPDDKTAALDEFTADTLELLKACGDERNADAISASIRTSSPGSWATRRGGVLLQRIDRTGDSYELRVTVL